MEPRLIIIRGNSASGKTTIAKRLQYELGRPTMLVSQDVIRREVLRVKDFPGNPSIQLIHDMVLFGRNVGYDVILEGILATKNYGDMLKKLVQTYGDNVYAYYFDLSFEETQRRHDTKPNKADYGEAEMREWWNDKDYLKLAGEKSINETLSEEQILALLLKDVPPKSI